MNVGSRQIAFDFSLVSEQIIKLCKRHDEVIFEKLSVWNMVEIMPVLALLAVLLLEAPINMTSTIKLLTSKWIVLMPFW